MQICRCKSSALIDQYNAHAHDEWEIVCQLEGEAQTEVGRDRYTVRPGDILLIPPHIVHKGSSDAGFRDLSLRADGVSFRSEAILHDHNGDVRALLQMILRHTTERTSGYETVVYSLVEALTHTILHLLGRTGSPAVEEVRRCIYEHLSDADFSLSDCIGKSGFDSDYFRRVFKRETGKTPKEYQLTLRLRRARQLLTEEEHLSVESVAHACGFADSLYFSTCFKKHIGLSPSAYRKQKNA